MAKLHDRKSADRSVPEDSVALLEVIKSFLAVCKRPAVLEYGEEVITLGADQFALETRSGRLWLEVWTDTRSISRRILGIERQITGVLECSIHRFGGKPGRLSFLDLDRPQAAHKSLSGIRQNFSEQFRRMLSRQFPGWQIEAVSCGLDLQRSFSSVFPRARLSSGNRQIAAMACQSTEQEPAMLTFALIWFDHVRAHRPRDMQTSLCLFLPETAGNLTSHRLSGLTGRNLRTRLFRFNDHGCAGEVDPQDLGNIETSVSAQFAKPDLNPDLESMLSRLVALPYVGSCPELNGSISVRSRGREFARFQNGKVFLGIEEQQQISEPNMHKVEQFAAELASLTQGSAVPSLPERWLECAVRSNLQAFDPTLRTSPVHGQVLTLAAGDRDLVDLLAATVSGRLSILEMKAREDVHLPLQALDYWIRIRWHARRGELNHLFPGVTLTDEPAKLLLVAPAMSFHSSNEIILRYFSPEIEVERIGINSDWQRHLKVVLRLSGGDRPISHESSQ